MLLPSVSKLSHRSPIQSHLAHFEKIWYKLNPFPSSCFSISQPQGRVSSAIAAAAKETAEEEHEVQHQTKRESHGPSSLSGMYK